MFVGSGVVMKLQAVVTTEVEVEPEEVIGMLMNRFLSRYWLPPSASLKENIWHMGWEEGSKPVTRKANAEEVRVWNALLILKENL